MGKHTPKQGPELAPEGWWRRPLLLFLVSLGLFAAFSDGRLLHQSQAPQFIYQAEAFLHGQTALTVRPPNLNDWARVHNQWYVSFPPFPAILMVPFVALWGFQLNDVSFTVFFAALNVVLLFFLLRQLSNAGDSSRTERENTTLALLFAFGTVDFYCSIRGEVWFTAEVLGVTTTCLYLLAAHRARHPSLAGVAFACAAITRTPLAFAFPFFGWELFAPTGRFDLTEVRRRRQEIVEKSLQFAGPVIAVALPMMWMNYVRFGNPTEFGHRFLYNNRVNSDVAQWGLFNVHYLWRNLRAAFLLLPGLSWPTGRLPQLTFDPHGMSLFVTTPLFALLFWPKTQPRLHRALWLTVAVVSLPGFFYQNDGWRQFGFRFSLDYTPYLFLLLAIGGRNMGRWFWGLAVLGVAVNLWGALAF
jgi:hypothetical protein